MPIHKSLLQVFGWLARREDEYSGDNDVMFDYVKTLDRFDRKDKDTKAFIDEWITQSEYERALYFFCYEDIEWFCTFDHLDLFPYEGTSSRTILDIHKKVAVELIEECTPLNPNLCAEVAKYVVG